MKTRKIFLLTSLFFVGFINYSNAQQYWHRVKGGLGHVGTGESVNALIRNTNDNKLYATGTFSVMDDSIGCAGIAIWNDTTWTSNVPLVGSINLYALEIFQGKIFDAGLGVGYYDTVWHTAGITNDYVYCMTEYHNKLYVGGRFTDVDGIQATFIACYDGANWSEPGGGIWCTQFPGDVKTMCVWNDKLIVGGSFDQAGGVSVHSVAAWNDTTWSDVGGGVIDDNAPTQVGMVQSLCVHNGDLIIGGWFDRAGIGLLNVNYICGYNGANWYILGNGVGDQDVQCLLSWDGVLYVGGGFPYAGSASNTGTGAIAKWDSAWHKVAETDIQSGWVFSMAVYDSVLYVGGGFNSIHGYPALHIARLLNYPDTTNYNDTTSIDNITKSQEQLIVSPNPFSETINLKSDFKIGDVLEIRNLLAIKVFEQKITNTASNISVSTINFQQGIYLCMLRQKNGAYSIVKVVKI